MNVAGAASAKARYLVLKAPRWASIRWCPNVRVLVDCSRFTPESRVCGEGPFSAAQVKTTGGVCLNVEKYEQMAFRTQENRKISPSDDCGESSVFSTVVRVYDFHKLEVMWQMWVKVMERFFDQPNLLELDPIPPAYSDKIAWQLAELCRLAYTRFEDEGEDPLKRKLSMGGFDLVETINRAGVQAFIVRRADIDMYALVFRGTELSYNDIKTDMSIVLVKSESGLMHSGFKYALDLVKCEIEELIAKIDSNNIYVAGHSLGGALAVIASSILSKNNKLAACYTFGCPKIGTSEVDWRIKTSVYRVVSGQDLVPRLPPGIGSVYQHVGDLRFITRDGRILRSPGFALDMFHFILGLLNLKILNAHGIKLYSERLASVALARLDQT